MDVADAGAALVRAAIDVGRAVVEVETRVLRDQVDDLTRRIEALERTRLAPLERRVTALERTVQ